MLVVLSVRRVGVVQLCVKHLVNRSLHCDFPTGHVKYWPNKLQWTDKICGWASSVLCRHLFLHLLTYSSGCAPPPPMRHIVWVGSVSGLIAHDGQAHQMLGGAFHCPSEQRVTASVADLLQIVLFGLMCRFWSLWHFREATHQLKPRNELEGKLTDMDRYQCLFAFKIFSMPYAKGAGYDPANKTAQKYHGILMLCTAEFSVGISGWFHHAGCVMTRPPSSWVPLLLFVWIDILPLNWDTQKSLIWFKFAWIKLTGSLCACFVQNVHDWQK